MSHEPSTLAVGEEEPHTTKPKGEEDTYTTLALGEEDDGGTTSTELDSPFGAF